MCTHAKAVYGSSKASEIKVNVLNMLLLIKLCFCVIHVQYNGRVWGIYVYKHFELHGGICVKACFLDLRNKTTLSMHIYEMFACIT